MLKPYMCYSMTISLRWFAFLPNFPPNINQQKITPSGSKFDKNATFSKHPRPRRRSTAPLPRPSRSAGSRASWRWLRPRRGPRAGRNAAAGSTAMVDRPNVPTADISCRWMQVVLGGEKIVEEKTGTGFVVGSVFFWLTVPDVPGFCWCSKICGVLDLCVQIPGSW